MVLERSIRHFLLVGFLCVYFTFCECKPHHDAQNQEIEAQLSNVSINQSYSENHEHQGIHVATFRLDYVRGPLFLVLFVLIIGLFKVAFHSNHLKLLAHYVPESCILIVIGIVLGTIFRFSNIDVYFLKFDDKVFFLYLLPPIILDSAYSLRDRAFLENLGTILLYAVFGSLLSVILIGVAMYGLQCGNILTSVPTNINIIDCLIFSSLISAVDPVAVLSIFEEVGVNKMLYYMVFGESLLNDAVIVVAYNLMVSFSQLAAITAKDIGLGFASFICVAGGGAAIGCFHGFLSAIFTKYSHKVKVVEPVAIMGIAYLSYLLAEMVHFSGIISIICCGVMQTHYALDNVSTKSFISISLFSKVMSTVTESLIFVLLGVMIINTDAVYDLNLDIWSIVLCLVVRFLVVYALTSLVNYREHGIREISHSEQAIMAYGGLRGAISFSLILMTPYGVMNEKDRFLSATFLVILFTVFVQGASIKPLVKLLRIKLAGKDLSIFPEVHRQVNTNLVFGMERILGFHGTYSKFKYTKNKSHELIRPIMQRHAKKSYSGLVLRTEAALIRSQSEDRRPSAVSVELMNHKCDTFDDNGIPHSVSNVYISDHEDPNTYTTLRDESGNQKRKSGARKQSNLMKTRDLLHSNLTKAVYFQAFDRNLVGVDQETHQEAYETNLRNSRKLSQQIKTHSRITNNDEDELLVTTMGKKIILGPMINEADEDQNRPEDHE